MTRNPALEKAIGKPVPKRGTRDHNVTSERYWRIIEIYRNQCDRDGESFPVRAGETLLRDLRRRLHNKAKQALPALLALKD